MTINDLIKQFPDNLDAPLYLRDTAEYPSEVGTRVRYAVTMVITECGFNTNLNDEPVFTDVLVLE